MKTRFLIMFAIGIIGFIGISFADESSDPRVPEPEQHIPVYENCGPGTMLQEGICIEVQPVTTNSTGKWRTVIETTVLSPLKQLKSGTNYNDIKCSDSKVLVLKHGRTFPACVNPDTVSKLFQRNWALNEVPIIDIETEEQESKLIKVMGVVNRFDTFEGFEYQFIPLQEELPRIAHSGYKTVNLFATDNTIHQFIRNLDGSLVKVHGSFLFENGEYWRYLSGFPIIPVEKLEVISENEQLDYSIDGAELISITKIPNGNSLNIVLDNVQEGTLEISIPRELIDAKISEKVDDLFFVFVDGVEVPYTENVGKDTRTLIISFEQGTKIIEIFGAIPL